MPTAAAALFEKQQQGWTFVDVLLTKIAIQKFSFSIKTYALKAV